jgi:hypothetical protein
MKKTGIAVILFLVCAALSFGDQFLLKGVIVNESDETIYCTSRIKEGIKEIFELDEIVSKENEYLYIGIVPFYWRGNYVVDIKGVGVIEYTEIRIPNTIIDLHIVIRNDLVLFQVGNARKFSVSPDNWWITNYYMKSIQLLDYFFSEITVYDGEGNIFLTLEDLREYYNGLEDEELMTNIYDVNLDEYAIIVTQEMIDEGRRKHGMQRQQ